MSDAERLKRLVFDLGDLEAAKALAAENKRKRVLTEDQEDVLGQLAHMEPGGVYRISFTVPDIEPYNSSHNEEIAVTDENMSAIIKDLMGRANGYEYMLITTINPDPLPSSMDQ